MNNPQKKVYTMEDNVKYISFGIKDLVKQLEELNATLRMLAMQKGSDDNSPPF